MNDATGRVARSLIQFLAGGGITVLVGLLANGLGPVAAAALLAFNTLAVTVAQNFAEQKGVIPAVLKPKPVGELVDSAGTVVGQVIGAATAEVEAVAGTVIDDVGDIIGAVGVKEEEDHEEA